MASTPPLHAHHEAVNNRQPQIVTLYLQHVIDSSTKCREAVLLFWGDLPNGSRSRKREVAMSLLWYSDVSEAKLTVYYYPVYKIFSVM